MFFNLLLKMTSFQPCFSPVRPMSEQLVLRPPFMPHCYSLEYSGNPEETYGPWLRNTNQSITNKNLISWEMNSRNHSCQTRGIPVWVIVKNAFPETFCHTNWMTSEYQSNRYQSKRVMPHSWHFTQDYLKFKDFVLQEQSSFEVNFFQRLHYL